MVKSAEPARRDDARAKQFSKATFDEQLRWWREHRAIAAAELKELKSRSDLSGPELENGQGQPDVAGRLIAGLKDDIAFFDRLIASYERRKRSQSGPRT